jgi:hypothetical protein
VNAAAGLFVLSVGSTRKVFIARPAAIAAPPRGRNQPTAVQREQQRIWLSPTPSPKPSSMLGGASQSQAVGQQMSADQIDALETRQHPAALAPGAADAVDVFDRVVGLKNAHAQIALPCKFRVGGLDPFREEDAPFFFGRGGTSDDPTSDIGKLVGMVREHSFVMVVGRSGSGKSSLVNAGLMPALRRDRSQVWTSSHCDQALSRCGHWPLSSIQNRRTRVWSRMSVALTAKRRAFAPAVPICSRDQRRIEHGGGKA